MSGPGPPGERLGGALVEQVGPVGEERAASLRLLVLTPGLFRKPHQRVDIIPPFLRWLLGWLVVLELRAWGGVTFYLQEQGEASSWAASFPEKA